MTMQVREQLLYGDAVCSACCGMSCPMSVSLPAPPVPQSLRYSLLGVAAFAVLAVSALVFTVMKRSRPRVEAIKL